MFPSKEMKLFPRNEFTPLTSQKAPSSCLQVFSPPRFSEELCELKILHLDSSPRKLGTPEAPRGVKQPSMYKGMEMSDRVKAIATPIRELKPKRIVAKTRVQRKQQLWNKTIHGEKINAIKRKVPISKKIRKSLEIFGDAEQKIARRPSRASSLGVDFLKRKFSGNVESDPNNKTNTNKKDTKRRSDSFDEACLLSPKKKFASNPQPLKPASPPSPALVCPPVASRIALWKSELEGKSSDVEEDEVFDGSPRKKMKLEDPSVQEEEPAVEKLPPSDDDPAFEKVFQSNRVSINSFMIDEVYHINLMVLENFGYHTQPVDGSPIKEADEEKEKARTPRSYGSQGRHLTQPITASEKENAADDSSPGNSSIQSRLALLKKSGEEGWRKRIGVKEGSPEVQEVKRRDKSKLSDNARPTSIADRLTLLEGSQQGWKAKVDEKDVKQFTVEGKMNKYGGATDSPLSSKRFNTPKMPISRDSDFGSNGSTPTSPTRPSIAKLSGSPPKPLTSPKVLKSHGHSFPSKSMPNLFDEKNKEDEDDEEEEEEEDARMVMVPHADDDDFRSFYTQSQLDLAAASQEVEVSLDDLNDIFLDAGDILPSTKRIRPTKRKAASSRNPLRRLQERQDLQQGYTEVKSTGVAEREVQRLKREGGAALSQSNSKFAREALAGLASKENFSKVTLKKADSFKGVKYAPYKDLMLLQVKGRRHCQTRLVEPKAESINSGDCFILVTSEKIFTWIGRFCNVIERAKAAEVTAQIHQKRELGCKCPREPVLIEEAKNQSNETFWELLGGEKPYPGSGPSEEDEIYEDCMNITNMVYKLYDDELDPVEEFWGKPLKHEMLDPKEALILDFGSELYMWAGKKCPLDKRRKGLRLAEDLWKTGYDYTECDVNPLCPLATAETGKLPEKDDKRPDWTVFGKVTQNMETILFREKFIDWPDTTRLIKVVPRTARKSECEFADLVPVDAKIMVPLNPTPVSLVLEASHVGRGRLWLEDMDGLHRKWEVSTIEMAVWHISEYEHLPMVKESYGQFHEGDTYVIRWRYKVAQTGMKTLKGRESSHATVGRERCAYFFWQGRGSSITEKGASALMTVELDEERGPQVRVTQGKEPPAFLQLFDGCMTVHRGKREDESTNTQGSWRCYIMRNELPFETCLLEVQRSVENLRSRTSFIIMNIKTGMLYVWHGAKSSSQCREQALRISKSLSTKCPEEISREQSTFVVTEMDEGAEKKDFWVAMDALRGDRSAYHSLLDDPQPQNYSPRLFFMTSVAGIFEAKEVLNPCRNHDDVVSAFPFMQTELYSASQPALFLVDVGHCAYLWQGWWPEESEQEENVKTGSAEARFNTDRRCALQTTIHYCQLKKSRKPVKAYLVHAGLEPLEFTNLFPQWEVREDVRKINEAEGRERDEITSVEDLLSKLLKTKYTWEELQERPLPEGVDPLKMEQFLQDDEFEEVMCMSREEFAALPTWKQGNIKKEVDLF